MASPLHGQPRMFRDTGTDSDEDESESRAAAAPPGWGVFGAAVNGFGNAKSAALPSGTLLDIGRWLTTPLMTLGVYLIERQRDGKRFTIRAKPNAVGNAGTTANGSVAPGISGDFMVATTIDKSLKQGEGFHLWVPGSGGAGGSAGRRVGSLSSKGNARGKGFELYGPVADLNGLGTATLPVEMHAWCKVKWRSLAKIPESRRIKAQLTQTHHASAAHNRLLRNFCAEKRTMTTKLALFDNPITSRKNCVLMWEQQPGIVGGDADANIVELAKVGDNSFQLNVKDYLTPLQGFGLALASITAEA